MPSEMHRALRSTLRRWADNELGPHAAEADQSATFPEASWESYVTNGWVRMQYPAAYGGDGADAISCAILIEEMARVCASSSVFALVGKLAMAPIINWATDELKQRYLPSVAKGSLQASYCLSEPDAGSDVGSLKTRAERDGAAYVLNGVKCWISNAGVSELYVVFAKTDPAAGQHGISCFVVERDWGVDVSRLDDKMGIRGSPTGEIILEDVRVPAVNRIGQEGEGFLIAMHTLDRTRPTIGAQAVGISQGAIDAATRYLQERHQFGRPIAQFQALQFMLADMAMRTEAARQLVYRACSLIDEADPCGDLTMVGAMAKCFASDVAMAVTTDAVQLLGGYGYTRQAPVERMMRDAKITQLYEGTNQIQRVVISRHLLRRNGQLSNGR